MSSSPPGAPASESLLAPEGPYRGLVPFSEQDAALFFGRDDECEVVIDNMMASRLTLLYGASGVGKTSLLRAGVTHQLLASSKRNLTDYGSPEYVVVYFNRWSHDPVGALIRHIHNSVAMVMGGQAEGPESSSAGLAETLHVWTTNLGSDLMIILDQFEEYFLYHPEDGGDGSFAVEFARAVNRPDLRVSFLVAIREDALARLDRFKGRLPNPFSNYLRTRHLDAAAARAAIEKPLEAYNRLVSAEQPFTAEPGLVQMVLDEVQIGKVVFGTTGRGVVEHATRPVADNRRIETPYLQLVLIRLWREEVAAGSHTLRAETLRRLGGAEQIVQTHLDEALCALPTRQQDVAAGILHHLVTPSGTKIAHTAPDLAYYTQLPPVDVNSVLAELSAGDVRILRPVSPPSGQPDSVQAYEIFHDVLAPAVLDWRARHVAARETDERLHEARRRLRRLGGLAAALGLLLIAAVAFGVIAVYQSHRADTQRERAVSATRLAASRQLTAEAGAALADDPHTSLLLGIAAQHLHDDADTRAGLVNSLIATRYAGTLAGHTRAVNKVAFSPDGRLLATGSDDTTVRIYSVSDPARPVSLGRPLTGHGGAVTSVAFSPDGRLLATGSDDTTVRIYSVSDPARPIFLGRPLTGHGGAVTSVAFSPDGLLLATAGADKRVLIWKMRNPARPQLLGRPLTGHTRAVRSLAFSRDGRLLATGGADKRVLIWKMRNPARPQRLGRPLTGHQSKVTSVAFSPDGHLLATGSIDHTVRLWRLRKAGGPVPFGRPLTDHSAAVFSVAFSPDGNTLVTAGYDGVASVLRLGRPPHSVQLAQRITGYHAAVNSVAFDPTGRTLAIAGAAGTATLWHLGGPAYPDLLGPPFDGGQGEVASLAFSPKRDHLLATGDAAGRIRLWSLPGEGAPVVVGAPFGGGQGEVASLAFSPDGRLLAAARGSGRTQLWDVRRPFRPVAIHPPLRNGGPVAAVAFSPDGQLLASGGDDEVTRVWSVRDPYHPILVGAPLRGHQEEVTSLAFSANGSLLASGGGSGAIKLWTVPPGGAPVAVGPPLDGGKGEVGSLAFSPRGNLLASAGANGVMQIWDVNAASRPKPIGPQLKGHVGALAAVAFSRDGSLLASGGDDGRTLLVDVHDPRNPVQVGSALGGHTGAVTSLTFSPDGHRLAIGTDKRVLMWGLAGLNELRNYPIERACALTGRGLSNEEWSAYISGLPYEHTCPNRP
jgi:WD40 repeat protein